VPVLGFIDSTIRALDDHAADVLALSVFSDEQPLEGITGLVDWRLRGTLSRWFISGFASGRWGERVLYPVRNFLSYRSLVVFGLGRRADHRADRALAVAHSAVETAKGLGARTLTCGLFGLDTLPSPFQRTGRQLMDLFEEYENLDAVTLVTRPEEQRVLLDGMES
jgi:hypothetical protein